MPGFRGIRMVSFDKNQQQVIVRAPQATDPIAYPVWPEAAVSTLVDIMVHFYAPILNEKVQSQKEAYYQKAFDAFAFHLMRLEKENALPHDFSGHLTKQEMFLKWQEVENKYNELAMSLVAGGPPGQQLWPYFDKMTFILKNERNRPPPPPPAEPVVTEQQTAEPALITNSPVSAPAVVEQESEEQRIISHIVDKSVSRVLEELRSDQELMLKQNGSFKEQSEYEFQKELLALMSRRVQLLEEQSKRQEEERVERKAMFERLTHVLEKLSEKSANSQ